MHWSNLRSMVIAVCSTSIRVTDCDADDVQRMLSQDGYLRKLANRVQGHLPSKRDGAITALTALGNTQGAGRRGVVVGRKLNATNVSEGGCNGGHQGSENDPCPCRPAQPEIDCACCRIGAGASREDW